VGAGQVKNPCQVFVDSEDNILVADGDNNRIQVFHQDGIHIKTLRTGQLESPFGVCMDIKERIVVSESGANRVSNF